MPRKPMTKDEFQRRFAEIRNKQYKRDERGTGGVGNTLENLLGLGVGSGQKADVGFAELKVRMKDAISSVKLFTLDSDIWRLTQDAQAGKFGVSNYEKVNGLHFEMRQGEITKTGLKFFTDNETVSILSPNDDVIAEWSLDKLIRTFERNVKEQVIVTAEMNMGAGGFDYFVYRHAFHLHGISKASLRSAFLQNAITLNVHIESISIGRDGSWKVKNRGTAFRINENNLEKLFENKDSL